ncbi:hypothetical protein L2E82_39622 [Cichorium intybus]|uniref:Uncharacterized protein n=1 Tax=Cichorium intybus TaxID=13427 RepID=A0ACB9AJQ2_CICIN|nr:hypothetical protein L2E82_39622 [Cichorium intybus]
MAMEGVKLVTAYIISMMVLLAFNVAGTTAQEFGVAPSPSPSMESTGYVLPVPAMLAVIVSLVACFF